MAPATSSPSSSKLANFIHRTHTPHNLKKLRPKKYRSMVDIMARARYTVVEKEDYDGIMLSNVAPVTTWRSCCCATNVTMVFI
jgi:hypothetical protein